LLLIGCEICYAIPEQEDEGCCVRAEVNGCNRTLLEIFKDRPSNDDEEKSELLWEIPAF